MTNDGQVVEAVAQLLSGRFGSGWGSDPTIPKARYRNVARDLLAAARDAGWQPAPSDRERVCYSDECGEPCQSWQNARRAEVAELKAQLAKVARRLGEARKRSAPTVAEIEAVILAAEPDPIGNGARRTIAQAIAARLREGQQ